MLTQRKGVKSCAPYHRPLKLRTALRYYYQRNQLTVDIALCLLTAIAGITGVYLCAYFGAEIDNFPFLFTNK